MNTAITFEEDVTLLGQPVCTCNQNKICVGCVSVKNKYTGFTLSHGSACI